LSSAFILKLNIFKERKDKVIKNFYTGQHSKERAEVELDQSCTQNNQLVNKNSMIKEKQLFYIETSIKN